MSTIMSVFSNGKCFGRCDARCHDALKPKCACICGGALHGVGSLNAQSIVHTIPDSATFARSSKLYGEADYKIKKLQKQLEMFV